MEEEMKAKKEAFKCVYCGHVWKKIPNPLPTGIAYWTIYLPTRGKAGGVRKRRPRLPMKTPDGGA